MARSVGLQNVVSVEREGPIVFRYPVPIARPYIVGHDFRAESVEVDGESVLVFGMIESVPTVRARSVVIDPQHSMAIGTIANISADRKAVIANVREIRQLGEETDHLAAAEGVRVRADADVVVVKMGAIGALVVERADRWQYIPPLPTDEVWPIGSGDSFCAGFANAWLHEGASAVEAAVAGARAAAAWCSTQSLPLPRSALEPGQPDPAVPILPGGIHVYLAGPFFDVAQRWLIEVVRDALLDLGAGVFSPYHHVGVGGFEVAKEDIDGLEQADAVLALLDGADPGTMFEAGWAEHANKPVVGYAERVDHASLTMAGGLAADLYEDLPTAVYKSVWRAMEAHTPRHTDG